MGSYKNQIFLRTDIVIASKLRYFGSLFGNKRSLRQNNQKFFCNSENKIEKMS